MISIFVDALGVEDAKSSSTPDVSSFNDASSTLPTDQPPIQAEEPTATDDSAANSDSATNSDSLAAAPELIQADATTETAETETEAPPAGDAVRDLTSPRPVNTTAGLFDETEAASCATGLSCDGRCLRRDQVLIWS